jgi:hypothetical protein
VKKAGSLSRITDRFIEYVDREDLKGKLLQEIKRLVNEEYK